jgi:hypothetical protein
MENVKKLLFVAGGAVAVVVIVALVAAGRPKSSGPGGIPTDGETTKGTRSEAPVSIMVPEKGTADVPENVAIPEVTAPANLQNTGTFRKFSMAVSGNKFEPNTFVIREGDTLHIDITAVDKNYDFTQPDIGYQATPLLQGKTGFIEFGSGVPAGKYAFYCSSCGGPVSGPVGYIIVAPR